MGVCTWTTGKDAEVTHTLRYKDGDWVEAPADYRIQGGDLIATTDGWNRASKDIGMLAGDYPAVLCPSTRDPHTLSESAEARRKAKAARAAPKKSAKKKAAKKKAAASKES